MLRILTNPFTWILAPLWIGLVLTFFGRRKRSRAVGRHAILAGTLLFTLLSATPVADFLTYSLEKGYRYPDLDRLAKLDFVVVLGGGGVPAIGLRTEPELARRAYPRLYHGVRLFHAGCGDQIAFCGGRLPGSDITESQIMQGMALQMGVPQENTVIERTSRSTQQNAAGLSEILAGTPIQRLGLVTSAMHMRRSQRVFKHYFPGVTVVPIPVDFSYNPPDLRLKYFIPNGPSFDRSREALHEYIGLLWYRLRYGMAKT